MVVECLPFWTLKYFPSQDGPSHLGNAVVFADYGSQPVYQQYYRRVAFRSAGNLVTQFLLVGLLKAGGARIAERILLSGYIVSLFLGLRYFLSALTPYCDVFSLFAGVLATNWFLYMGFWNFLYSASILLAMLGYYVRRQDRDRPWTPASIAILGAAGFILYMTHLISWVICIVAIGILGLPRLVTAAKMPPDARSLRKAAIEYLLPLVAAVSSFPFLLLHLSHPVADSVAVRPPTLRESLWSLYSLSFLHTIVEPDLKLAKGIVAILCVGLIVVLGTFILRRQEYRWQSTAILGVSVVCAIIALAGPDSLGAGRYIRTRVAFYVWIFLAVWLASALKNWPRVVLHAMGGVFFCLAVIGLATKLPFLTVWNQRISEFVQLGSQIRPGSTAMMLFLERPQQHLNPLLHAIGLFSPEACIDLGNYEATTDLFITEFRPDRSPVPALGTTHQIQEIPPQFDIDRYEKETRGRVDYLVFYGHPTRNPDRSELTEQRLYGPQLVNYSLVGEAEGGTIRLYSRFPRATGSVQRRSP